MVTKTNYSTSYCSVQRLLYLVVAQAIWSPIMRSLPSIFKPLNLYEIVGTLCCLPMHNECSQNNLVNHFFCYNARSLFEANMVLIWGGISEKLATRLSTYCSYLPTKHAIFHIKGCHQESLLTTIPTIRIIDKCSLTKEEACNVLREARQCLTA